MSEQQVIESSNSNKLVYITIAINSILGLSDRVLQLCYYCITTFDDKSVRNVALTFCILPSGINILMILIYVIFHHEEMLTPIKKVKILFMYLISSEALFPIGMQKSFKTKFSEYTDNPIVTMKVINALHLMFVSIPQILIVCIYSSSIDYFNGIGIASLVLAIIFILWSVGYYFVCISCEDNFESEIEKHTKEI